MSQMHDHTHGFKPSRYGLKPIYPLHVMSEVQAELLRLEEKVHLSRLGSLTNYEKLRLVEIAIWYFGRSINHYLTQQGAVITNQNEKALEFITETIEFIDTGFRGMSLDFWSTNIQYPVNRGSYNEVGVKDTYVGRVLLPELPFNYIDDWVNKPNGFADLASTLFILFGRNSLLTERK